MIKGVTHAHYDQFGIIQNLQTFPIPQTSFLVETFFAASYSKTALASGMAYKKEEVDSEHICDLWPKMHFDTNH